MPSALTNKVLYNLCFEKDFNVDLVTKHVLDIFKISIKPENVRQFIVNLRRRLKTSSNSRQKLERNATNQKWLDGEFVLKTDKDDADDEWEDVEAKVLPKSKGRRLLDLSNGSYSTKTLYRRSKILRNSLHSSHFL
eukprot:Pompholyxophrys_punicea_v1_NODE_1258_length_834_cov_4.228498.p1 type:complete len:136 gc:universal NODE_1258_length_834_cov_4.228498:566-159(-)